jgi:hypothetical protein
MFSRFAALTLLLSSVTVVSRSAAQSDTRSPKIFHDQALGITYAYPGAFTPVTITPAAPATAEKAEPECVRSVLSAGAATPRGNSVFVISSIDDTCPQVLNAAQKLGPFTREQILRELKQYGAPEITQGPTRYSIDGHPAAVTLASVQPDTPSSKTPATTYAAKACVLDSVPVKGDKSSPASPANHVVCFDFTAPQKELLLQTLAFTIQFQQRPPQALVPGTIFR